MAAFEYQKPSDLTWEVLSYSSLMAFEQFEWSFTHENDLAIHFDLFNDRSFLPVPRDDRAGKGCTRLSLTVA